MNKSRVLDVCRVASARKTPYSGCNKLTLKEKHQEIKQETNENSQQQICHWASYTFK